MNRDEALKCWDIAKGHYNNGDYERALKFFNKSYQLERSDLTLQYIKKCQEKIQQGNSSSHQNGSSSSQRAHREEHKSSTPAGGSSKSNEPVPDDVKKILATKDFYELLGVTKTSTDDEIKKAYRKLALKFHPDKNQANKADEAFKKIAQAYDCLSNPEKKRKYDEYGSEEPEQHFQHYRQYYSEEVSPEDIFDMFFSNFGGPGVRTRTYYRGGGGQRGQNGSSRQQGPQNPFMALLQFLPLLLIFGTSILFNFTREDPAYSLTQSYKYPILRQTISLNYPYYVDKEFVKNYANNQRKLQEIERDVEINTLNALYERCYKAQNQKASLENRARYYKGESREVLLNQANNVDLSSCQSYDHARKVRPDLFRNSYYY